MSEPMDDLIRDERTLASMLADMAGNDPTLPGDRTDPAREWVCPGHYKGEPKPLTRLVGVRRWGDDARTVYTLIAGMGYKVDVWHCYPKDQWTAEEAAAAHAAYMAG